MMIAKIMFRYKNQPLHSVNFNTLQDKIDTPTLGRGRGTLRPGKNVEWNGIMSLIANISVSLVSLKIAPK